MADILLLNGVNLNTLGTRETDVYGQTSLIDIEHNVTSLALKSGYSTECLQSNIESDLISKIHNKDYKVIIFNPAAWTHSSIALRDALLSVDAAFVEIHISNIYKREEFRHRSYFSDIAIGLIAGCGVYGYELATLRAVEYLNQV